MPYSYNPDDEDDLQHQMWMQDIARSLPTVQPTGVADPQMGQYRGQDIQGYDPGLLDRQNQLLQSFGNEANASNGRAAEQEAYVRDLIGKVGMNASLGSIRNKDDFSDITSPILAANKNKYDKFDANGQMVLGQEKSMAQKVDDYVKNSRDFAVADEQKDYSRGRDAVGDARYEAETDYQHGRDAKQDARIATQDDRTTQDWNDKQSGTVEQVGYTSDGKLINKVTKKGNVSFRFSDGSEVPGADLAKATRIDFSQDRRATSPYQKGETYKDPDTGQRITSVFNPNTGNLDYRDEAGKAVTDPEVIRRAKIDSASTQKESLTPEDREVSKEDGKAIVEFNTAARGAEAARQTAKRTQALSEQINKDGWVGTGPFNSAAQTAGNFVDFDGQTKNRQLLQKQVATELSGQIASMKGLGGLSDKDMAALQQRLTTGDLSPDTITSLTNDVQSASDWVLQKHSAWRAAKDKDPKLSFTNWDVDYNSNNPLILDGSYGDPSKQQTGGSDDEFNRLMEKYSK